MSRNTKLILVSLAAILLICGLGCAITTFVAGRFASTAVVQAPEQVRTMSREIADYTLPPGFDEGVGMNMIVMKMVMHARRADAGIIMMAALPSGQNVNEEDLKRGLQQGMAGGSGNVRLESNRELTLTVAGKPVTAREQTGVLDTGTRVKSLSFPFTSSKGLAFTMIMMNEASWNQAEVDAFVAGLK
jgi:hypothetical protein